MVHNDIKIHVQFNDFNKCVCDTDYITECFQSWLDQIGSNYDLLEEDCNIINVKFKCNFIFIFLNN